MTDPGFVVRGIEHRDLPAVVALDKEAFGEEVIGPHELRTFYDLAAGVIFVAEAPEGLCGYSIAAISGNGVRAWSYGLAVTPSFQRRGVASAIGMAQGRALLECKVQEVWTTCRPDNTASIKLQESLGFVPQGVEKDYFGPGKDRLLLRLDLAALTEWLMQ